VKRSRDSRKRGEEKGKDAEVQSSGSVGNDHLEKLHSEKKNETEGIFTEKRVKKAGGKKQMVLSLGKSSSLSNNKKGRGIGTLPFRGKKLLYL